MKEMGENGYEKERKLRKKMKGLWREKRDTERGREW